MTENKQADFHIIAMLDRTPPPPPQKNIPRTQARKETCAVIKLKRGTTDPCFAGLLLSLLWQLFTLNTAITDFFFKESDFTVLYSL